MVRITEEYTSRTCPNCQDNSKSNCNDRDFECSACGYKGDRDLVGARNIFTKGMCGSLESTHRDEVVPLEVLA